MKTRLLLVRSACCAAFCVASIASHALAGGVRNVNQPAQGVFFEIADAAAAAADGDTLLVGAGQYAGFTLDGKALKIFGAPGQLVEVTGSVQFANLSSAHTVVLAGLEITGSVVYPFSSPGLSLVNVAANVRIQSCALNGGGGAYDLNYGGAGGDGLAVWSCPRVVVAGSTLRGGHGLNSGGGDCSMGGNGGIGLHAINSSVATYRTPVYGGDGGNAYDYGGMGGDGCALQSSTLFASGCSFHGGKGGDTQDNFYVTYGGNGGDGLDLLDAAAHAGLLDDTFVAGAGGIAYGLPANSGSAGQPIGGPGTTQMFTGPQRTLTASTRIISDTTTLGLTVEGAPGDTVFLVSATRLGFSSPGNTIGPFLLHTPIPISTDPVGTIPAGGSLNLTVPIALLDPSAIQRIDHFQVACVSTSGQHYLTGTASVEVLDPSRPPDCDANGVNDYLDTISGAVLDCDHNLRPDVCDPDCDGNGVADGCEIATGAQQDCNGNHIPDNCELAAGTSFDCNGNGVLDQCDIANGTSQDQNHNGIPDECEGPHIWFVDASAASGGNGSSTNPFNNLSDAFTISVSGDTIRVRDGLYHGPKNRNLDFLDRKSVV